MSPIALKPLVGAGTLLAIHVMAFVHTSFDASSARAQGFTNITPSTEAGSLGTAVTRHGHTVQITGGTRPGNGTNLFHSFDQFNVGSADTAQFLNTTPSLSTSNILSRVTGGTPSSIFGTIDTISYPEASLFLMNPAGIVFGPNAVLSVGGSVAFTTADYLRLAEANGSNVGIFQADTAATSLLSSAPVAAFGFLGANPAAIAVQGSTLVAQAGQSVSFVGGNQGFSHTNISVPDGVTITSGHLRAAGGRITIASVASPGEIVAGTLDKIPNIKDQSFGALGTVQISQDSEIDTSGKGHGTILIRGGRLDVDTSTISANIGDIFLDATSIRITNGAQIATITDTAVNAGHITLKTSGDIVLDGVLVESRSDASSGNAGNITISSDQGNVSIVSSSFLSSSTAKESSGNTGNILIDAPFRDINLDTSDLFNSASGTGALGNIQINAGNLHLRGASKIGGDNTSTNIPGNITITLDGQLNLAGGSVINTGALGSVASADLLIQAPEVVIAGKAGRFPSGLFTSTISSGDGGRLRLFTDNLQLTDGGILSSKSFIGDAGEIPSGRGGVISVEGLRASSTSIAIDGAGSGIFSSAEGTGSAGDIDLKATSVTIQNGGTLSAETTGTSSTATGGSIIVNATDRVILTNGASITASSKGPADAGKIDIDAGQQLDLTNGSSITTTTQSRLANGGNIDIRAFERVRLVDSKISTSVNGAEGSGGNIFIDPKVVILEGSNVTAKAIGGSGGNITFITPLFLKDSASVVNASSQRGASGTVTIQSPTSNLSGTVGQLVSKTSPPQVLLQNRCIALAGGEQSTFILAGRDALPSQPGGWLSSPVAMEHWTGDNMEEHASGLMVRRVGPRDLSPVMTQANGTEVLSLRRLTQSGFLVRSFAGNAPTDCRS